MKTFVQSFFLFASGMTSAFAAETFCNPMSLPDVPIGVYCRDVTNGMALPPSADWRRATWYQRTTRSQFREVADPTVYVENGVWYLYPSGGLLWKSTDKGGSWTHVEAVRESDYAPAFAKFRGKYYLATFKGPLCVADSPEGPFREIGFFNRASFGNDPKMARFYDPDFLVDGDRIFLYWGCCNPNEKALWGAELDPDNLLNAKAPAVCLLEKDPVAHPWQQNVEGAWVFKYRGTYYFTYSVGGTESPRYAWVAMKGPTPLGPFTHQQRNPFLQTPNGLVTGTAHGSIFEDEGELWAAYCVLVGDGNYFERLCGLDRIGVDENGDLHVSVATSTPQWLPGSGRHGPTGWTEVPLVSSAKRAVDGSLSTSWKLSLPPTEVMFDLERRSVLKALRIVWKDGGLDTRNGIVAGPFRYRVHRRNRGAWSVWIDASQNDRDLLVDYREGASVEADGLRLEVIAAPNGITPGLAEFTAFGIVPETFE